MYVWAKLLGVLPAIATLPNSLVNYLGSCSKCQKVLRIADTMGEGNSEVLTIKRSSEEEVPSGICINCLLKSSV